MKKGAIARIGRRLLIASIALVIVVGAASVGLVKLIAERPVNREDTTSVEFTVPAGAPLRLVARKLEKADLVRSALVVRAWAAWNRPLLPRAGRHMVSPSMNVEQLLVALAATPLSDDAPLTIVEGWRLFDTDRWLSDGKLAARGAYEKAGKTPTRFKATFNLPEASLEGYLFPETYRVPVGALDVDALIQRQLDVFTERFARPYADEIVRSGRSLHDIVVIASLLEREEPDPARRPEVAGVIGNRLQAGSPLGIDATSRYGLDDWTDEPAFRLLLKDKEHAYNSRLRPGLPPTAIGAASLASLIAALRPVKTPYWYYLHDREGRIHFGKNAEEHEENRRRYNVY